ncbi:hypothetical protein SDC9_185476 [bioreactor metagenome]|uniref:Uncharacterized protein n=1 Tax=bioreactor metagenome TaxID=1076179 RepID=A0A645HFZ4_9ZZZZ
MDIVSFLLQTAFGVPKQQGIAIFDRRLINPLVNARINGGGDIGNKHTYGVVALLHQIACDHVGCIPELLAY